MHPPSQRNILIDLLRGLAILLVMLLHFGLSYGVGSSPLAGMIGKPAAGALIYNGNYGVTMFFAISGFLISSHAIERYGSLGRMRMGHFYRLRFARIFPSLLLALAVIVALGLFGLPFFANARQGEPVSATFYVPAVLSVLTFWHNVLMQHEGYFNYCLNIYWSLSVEEVFYLGYPLLCVILRRDGLIAAFGVLLIVLGPFYRGAHEDNEIEYMYAYPACFDAIAFGCIAALLARRIRLRRWQAAVVLVVAGGGLCVTYFQGIGGHERFGFTAIAAFTSLMLLASSSLGAKTVMGWGLRAAVHPLAWIGAHSYELYLFHIIVLAGLRNFYPPGPVDANAWWSMLGGFFAASCVVAAVVARWVGRPASAWLRTPGAMPEAAAAQPAA